MPITLPKMIASLFLRKLMRCIKLLTAGKRVDRSLTRACILFMLFRWETKCSFVSIAILIWSSTNLSELRTEKFFSDIQKECMALKIPSKVFIFFQIKLLLSVSPIVIFVSTA